MNTKGTVLGLVAVVIWLVCALNAGKALACRRQCAVGEVLDTINCICYPATTEQHCNCRCQEGEVLNVTACKCYRPKQECPQVKCLTTIRQCVAYRWNPDTGCRACDCQFYCPARKCPEKCVNGAEYFIDQYGCFSCRCKQAPSCGNTTCILYCAQGYEQDQNGCDICKCKPCGNLCKIFCEFGKLKDYDGCDICECKPKEECGPVCPNVTCENGRLLDDKGCPTCQCVKDRNLPCGDTCRRVCEFGYVYDKYGCQTCECQPDPNCGRVCDIDCPNGRVFDEFGCPTCQCL